MDGISLKKNIKLEPESHILYVFHEQSSYLENLVAYARDGIQLDQNVVILEDEHTYHALRSRLLSYFSEEVLSHYLFFENNFTFYKAYNDFDSDAINQHFGEWMESAGIARKTLRTWARIVWREQSDIIATLSEHEQQADETVKKQQLISVCAYQDADVPSELLVHMLRHHDYFMTDKELTHSPLYRMKKTVFPSLSVQSKMESEIDLYKAKLDFVHVVSHEVRNPLTIINGYANLLQNTETSLTPEGEQKLIAIEHYVEAIDQELTHIIETEQMLSNDLYTKLEHIAPFATVEEVVRLMQTKSIVENVDFKWNLDLTSEQRILGNSMGLKLILSNLISNAIKYTNEQGLVQFSAEVQDGYLHFVVKDNGFGMSEDQLNRLFNKYAKMDDSKSGQGIGLYVVKNLTDRFKGNIHFHSELGKGTTVRVSFPLLSASTLR